MRFSRNVKVALALLVVLVPVAFVFHVPQRVSKRVERGWLILTGRLVDVGGHRLRIECQGKGAPTVVMDSGLNMTMDTWGSVPAEVATFTRVCIYDRAGLGLSDPGPRPKTSQQIVNELHVLLANARIGGPYILVGHSFGGLNVRLFASQYRDEVAGIVLVDASHEAQYERLASLKPPEEREEYLRHEGGGNYERVDLLASAVQIRQAAALPSVPLLVLSAKHDQWQDPRMAQAVEELQSETARLLPTGKQIIAQNSRHFIQLDRPFLVTDSIFVVVNAARNHLTSL